MKQKYLVFGNKVYHGFGNQLRSIVGWYQLSKILGRRFVLSNTLMNLAFDSPFNINNFPDLPKITAALQDKNADGGEMDFFVKSCHESNTPFIKVDIQNDNFHEIKEDVIEVGGGKPMIWELSQNKNHNKEISSQLNLFSSHNTERLSQKLLLEIFPSLSKKWENLPLHCSVNLKSKYSIIQFRSFADAGWEGIKSLDEFISHFPDVHSKYSKNKSVFVTSDNPGLTAYICHSIQKLCSNLDIKPIRNPRCECCGNEAFLHSYSSETNKITSKYPLMPIKDWRIIGGANFIYSSGTSFVESAAQYFNIPYFFWSAGGRKGFKDMSA